VDISMDFKSVQSRDIHLFFLVKYGSFIEGAMNFQQFIGVALLKQRYA